MNWRLDKNLTHEFTCSITYSSWMLICSHIELSLLLYRLAVANLTTERDSSLQQLADCVADLDLQVREASKLAPLEERGHYPRKEDHYKHKSMKQASQISSLTNCTIAAEVQQKKAERQVHKSTKCSQIYWST